MYHTSQSSEADRKALGEPTNSTNELIRDVGRSPGETEYEDPERAVLGPRMVGAHALKEVEENKGRKGRHIQAIPDPKTRRASGKVAEGWRYGPAEDQLSTPRGPGDGATKALEISKRAPSKRSLNDMSSSS